MKYLSSFSASHEYLLDGRSLHELPAWQLMRNQQRNASNTRPRENMSKHGAGQDCCSCRHREGDRRFSLKLLLFLVIGENQGKSAA